MKSQNILLARNGTAKISDVGLARILHQDYVTSLDSTGTFAWAAPELLLGRRCTEKVHTTQILYIKFQTLPRAIPCNLSPDTRHSRESSCKFCFVALHFVQSLLIMHDYWDPCVCPSEPFVRRALLFEDKNHPYINKHTKLCFDFEHRWTFTVLGWCCGRS